MAGLDGRIRGEQPKLTALSEILREIGEKLGEDLAFASLRAANPRQPDPVRGWLRGGHLGLRLWPAAQEAAMLGFVALFEDVERVAVVQFHTDGAQDGSHRAGCASLLADDLAYIRSTDWTSTAFGSSTRARAISRTNSSTCTISTWVMILHLTFYVVNWRLLSLSGIVTLNRSESNGLDAGNG
jgi:hypothetical protein